MNNSISGEVQAAKPMSAAFKAAAVLMGALLTGIFWKVRGSTGWGSLWGLLCVGFFYMMFLIVLSGGAKRLTAALLGVTAGAFMFTAPAWGTLNMQIIGYIPGVDIADKSLIEVTPLSGAFIMLVMGFGLATLFAFFVGLSFSGKSYKLWHFAVILILFFAFDYFTRAFVSPYILRLVQPQAESLFEYGLAQSGLDITVYNAHLTHIFDFTWSKDFIGGRNYFASVKSISSAIRTLCLALTVRFAFKDKVTARIMTVVSSVFAFSILAADLILYFGSGGYHMQNPNPNTILAANGWTLWEYSTGFISGFLLTVYILHLLKKYRHNLDNTCVLDNSQRYSRFEAPVTFILTILLCMGISPARAIISRLTDTTGINLLPEVALIFAAAIVPCILIAVVFGAKLQKPGIFMFYLWALPCLLTLQMIIYFFIGDSSCTEWRHFSVSILPEIVLFSWIAFLVIYFIVFRKALSSTRK